MVSWHGLRPDEAEWLVILGRGRIKKLASQLGIPDRVLQRLIHKGLVLSRSGFIEITSTGMAEALRVSATEAARASAV